DGSGAAEFWLPTPEFDRWRSLGTGRRWVALASAWLASSRVVGLVGSRPDAARDKALNALGKDLDRALAPEIRTGVLRELADLPPGTPASAVATLPRLTWPRPRRGGSLRAELVGWTLAETELLGMTGRGALTSFGRSVLAGDPE